MGLSDFFEDFADSAVGGLIVGGISFLVNPAAGFIAPFLTTTIAGGVSRALAKEPDFSQAGVNDVTVTTRDPARSRKLVYGKRRIGGTIVYAHSTNGDSQLHFVIALCEGPIEAIDEIYFNDEVAVEADGTVSSKFSGKVQVDKVLGSTSQAASSLAIAETPDTGNGAWTSDHRLRGVAYIYVELTFDRDKFPQGVPNISAVVRGRNDITDPRDSSTGYTTNPALILKHYIEDTKYGLNGTVDDAAVSTAANVCDEQVSLKSGGTEDRYTLNGIVDSSDRPKKILTDMVNSMAGALTWSGGNWVMYAGEYRTPVMTLTEDNMISALSVATRVSRRERFNSVRGTYISPTNDYQPADFPVYKDSSAITEDNSETIWQNIELPYTATASMAQRLARIEVERIRREIKVEGVFDLSALQLVAGDTVQITYDRFGWSSKVFEVVDLDLEFSSDELGVGLTLREFDSGVFTWSSSDESEVSQAPETDLPNPFSVSAPTNLTLASGTAQLFVKKDGTVVSRIKATWDQSAGAFVDRYQVQYKKSADSDWTNAGDVDDDNRVAYVWEVEDDVAYDVRVRAVNQLGVRSDSSDPWSATVTNHTVTGKTEAPPDVDEFAVAVLADGTRKFIFSINSPPADLAGFIIKFVAGSSTDYASMTRLTPQGELVASPFETNEIPSGLHSFGIKAVDRSGNESNNALFMEQVLPNPRLAGVFEQRVERDLDWPGTLTNFTVGSDNVLRTSTETTGSYETAEIDLGADAVFTPRITVSAQGFVTKEMKTGTESDGNVTGDYDPIDTVRGARYVKIRITVDDSNPELSALTTLIDGEIKTIRREDVDTASESASWFNSISAGHFQVAADDSIGAITGATIRSFIGVTTPHTGSIIHKGTDQSETTAVDDAGSNNGTLSGGPVWTVSGPVDGAVAGSLLFDRTDDEVLIGDVAALEFTSTFTVEAWIKSSEKSGTEMCIFSKKATTGTGDRGWLVWLTADAKISAGLGGSPSGTYFQSGTASSTAQLNDGEWHHVAVVFTLSSTAPSIKIYLDGVFEKETDIPADITDTSDTVSAYIGRKDDDGGAVDPWYFDGLISEVRAWNDERTQSEIQNNKDARLAGTEAGLVGYWPLDDGAIIVNNRPAAEFKIFDDTGALADATVDIDLEGPKKAS